MSATQPVERDVVVDDGGASIIELKDQIVIALAAEVAYFTGGIPDNKSGDGSVLVLRSTVGVDDEAELRDIQDSNREFLDRVFGVNRAPEDTGETPRDPRLSGMGLTGEELEYTIKTFIDKYDIIEVRDEVYDATGKPTGTGALILRNRDTDETVIVTDGTESSPDKGSFYIKNDQTGDWERQALVGMIFRLFLNLRNSQI